VTFQFTALDFMLRISSSWAYITL